MQQAIDFRRAQFSRSAPSLVECPADEGAEVAFAGRSNAGKSSAINTLTGNSKLARTSKTPGRTQLLNFFDLEQGKRLVDLPGYGYAKVPQDIKNRWQKNLFDYLQRRLSLRGLVLLMDIRHPLQDYDTQLINWAVEAEMPVHILLTKSDKLKSSQRKSTLLKVSQHLQAAGVNDLVSVQTFSSLKREGLEELVGTLNRWLHANIEAED